MKYIAADFKINATHELLQTARDLVADAAGNAGFESFEDTPEGLKGYVSKELLDKKLLAEQMADICLPDVTVSYTLEDVEDKNWNETWEQNGFEPISINDKIMLLDARKNNPGEVQLPKGVLGIYIQARLAFGTGTHQTTRMVISALLDQDLQGKHVLDCGCGTGILAIAATKLGAGAAVGYDIDEWSVDNARHNATLNGSNQLQILHGDAAVLSHVSGLFDVVLANINRNILLADMPTFKHVMTSDGTLILSGFYEQDADMLIDRASELHLRLKNKMVLDDWCCLIFTLA